MTKISEYNRVKNPDFFVFEYADVPEIPFFYKEAFFWE